jgi:uncharacterized paraquat-inducible protein A
MIRYRCSQCRAVLHAPDFEIGVLKSCQHCGKMAVVPATSDKRDPLPPMFFATIFFVLILILTYITGFCGLSLIGNNSCKLFKNLPQHTTAR